MKLLLKIPLLIITAGIMPSLIAFFLGGIALPIFLTSIAISVSLGTVSYYLVSRRLTADINKIISHMANLQNGHFNQLLDIRSKDELGEIAIAFNQLTHHLSFQLSRSSQDKDLASAERNKLAVILSSIADGIIALDLSRKVILANPAAQRLTGYEFEEMSNRPVEELIKLYYKEEVMSPTIYCPTSLNAPKGMVYKSPEALTLVGKNDQRVLVQLLGSQINEGISSSIGCILVIHDVTKEHELETMKLDFVSMASHELRTPLTSIIGYLSVFINENKSKLNTEQMTFLDRIYISAKQVIALVENLLNVSKIERGVLSVSIVSTDLSIIANKVVQDLQNQAKQKNITLTFQNPTNNLPKVLADPLLINEVLSNLVTNAINYTKEGGKVNVYTQSTTNEVVVSVADTGVGIPKEAIPHLFSKFFRVSAKLEQGSKGTGLGLYISKSIIDRHKGRIWVESELGKGSKFSFSLPVATSTLGRRVAEQDLILPVN